MKLTTEKILPYVLHGVQFITEGGLKFRVQPSHFPNGWKNEFGSKLILRPLSDLTKEIEVNGEKFVPRSKFFGNPLDYIITKNSYEVVQQLISWHFDIFGLIDAGLAIDINTLK